MAVKSQPTFQEEREPLSRLADQLAAVLRGKDDVIRWTIACLVANGHLLIEDVPGVGKTTLVVGLAKSVGLSFRRLQFTSDLLPTDIVGVSVYDTTKATFTFRPGPIFSNIVLADEINRTPPRTQSALLEAMSEGRVSVDDATHELPNPFLVIATQNPLEQHGTYPLPESQLDRFLMRLSIGYPSGDTERAILRERGSMDPTRDLTPVLTPEELAVIRDKVDRVHVGEDVLDYMMAIVRATRFDPRVRIGVSTRGALLFKQACRALAVVDGRDFVISDDARELVVPVLAHRISLASSVGVADANLAQSIIEELATQIEIPT
jgi:MoxR-like ATPase